MSALIFEVLDRRCPKVVNQNTVVTYQLRIIYHFVIALKVRVFLPGLGLASKTRMVIHLAQIKRGDYLSSL
jgi:hypothetical protein